MSVKSTPTGTKACTSCVFETLPDDFKPCLTCRRCSGWLPKPAFHSPLKARAWAFAKALDAFYYKWVDGESMKVDTAEALNLARVKARRDARFFASCPTRPE